MDLKFVFLAINQLSSEVEEQKKQIAELQKEVTELKTNPIVCEVPATSSKKEVLIDELMNTQDVMKILGVSFNTLYKIYKQGLIERIKINQRRIRYTTASVQKYINSQSKKIAVN